MNFSLLKRREMLQVKLPFCIIIWLSSRKKCFEHEHVTDSNFAWLSCNIQHTEECILNREEKSIKLYFVFTFKTYSMFFLTLHSRCVKCDECSRLARSRCTRFDCSNSVCNCLHCSSDNLSEAFA